ncbi:MAG: glycosyltransferase [Gammaproteobacteria bacterium]|nr:glycosyltransferase [Gammaproteobacteria bacterium]
MSVIIPTFNRSSVIGRAIDSVLSQSYLAHEVIVIDDGSSDDTHEILIRYGDSIRIVSQSNQGVSAARNAGIGISNGKWIALLDSDDEWMENKLEKQVEMLSSNPEFKICHTDEIWIRNGRRVNAMKKHAKPDGWIFNRCLPLCCVSPSSVLINREVLDHVGLFDESLPACEDYDLWLRIFSQYSALLVPENLIKKYGGHDDQLSRLYWGMDRFRVRSLIKILESGEIDEVQKAETRDVLVSKLAVLANGFRKRNKHTECDFYQSLLNNWSSN